MPASPHADDPIVDALASLCDQTSAHALLHAFVDLCYLKARQCARQRGSDAASYWNNLAQHLTQAEEYVRTVAQK